MNINLRNYLSDEEIKEIVVEEFKDKCREMVRSEFDTLFTNVAYDIVLQQVNQAVTEDCLKLVTTQVERVINDLSSFNVFTYTGSDGKTPSAGHAALVEAVTESKPLLKRKVESLIEGLDGYDIGSHVTDALVKILKGQV